MRQGGEAARRGMARQLLEARVYQRARGCDAWTRRFENGMSIFHLPNPPTWSTSFCPLSFPPSPFIIIMLFYSGFSIPLLHRIPRGESWDPSNSQWRQCGRPKDAGQDTNPSRWIDSEYPSFSHSLFLPSSPFYSLTFEDKGPLIEGLVRPTWWLPIMRKRMRRGYWAKK